MSSLGFKARMGNLIRIWRRLTLLQQFENDSIKYECFSEKNAGFISEGFTVCCMHTPSTCLVKYVGSCLTVCLTHITWYWPDATCALAAKDYVTRTVLKPCQTGDSCKQTIIDTPPWFTVIYCIIYIPTPVNHSFCLDEWWQPQQIRSYLFTSRIHLILIPRGY